MSNIENLKDAILLIVENLKDLAVNAKDLEEKVNMQNKVIDVQQIALIDMQKTIKILEEKKELQVTNLATRINALETKDMIFGSRYT